ncbi:MAG: hypothetical protein NT159_19540 [Proteobacteria bacterium]|nr:hypothetical protein [Pseudomonadota bacterium]
MRKIPLTTSTTRPIRYRAEFNLLTVCRLPKAGSRRREIDALSSLASDDQVYDRLREIAGAYGKINSIMAISSRQIDEDIDPEECLYLIDFDRTQDALDASADTGCYLFGFSALAVPVRTASRGIKAPVHRYTH